ncbi:MAG: FHIPEP family type III secretion protein, partial [Candidatus Gastranaerophilaceae bacterium]
KYLESNVKNTINGQIFDIPQEQINELIEMTAKKLMMAHQSIGRQPVVLCSPKFRQALYSVLVKHLPTVVVMSHAEVATNVRVETVEIIESYDIPSYNYLEGNVDDEEFYEEEPLLGRVIDSDGNPLDGGIENYSLEEMLSEIAPADSSEPAPIIKIFKTGVRAVDAFLTIGYGQKMAVFANSGCGLSSFLGMIINNSEADINIVSLVSNSIDNAWEFINDCIRPNQNTLRKTIVIVSTPLDSAEKIKKNFETAVSLCEYYRDKGKNVLFINATFKPILDAAEIVARKNGEPACENDYRLEVTRWYQNLINRCKNNDKGSITTILTLNLTSIEDKAVDIVRSAVQGHIFLSRKVAEQNIYPAIDVLGSISRFHCELANEEQKKAAFTIRKILSLYRENAEFFNSDKYVVGENPQNDFIVKKYNEIISFIQQRTGENPSLQEIFCDLVKLASNINFIK